MNQLSDNTRYLEILFPWYEDICSIQPDIDIEDTDIPFVTNGYWHGVIDLEEHRLLGFRAGGWPMYIQAKVRDEGIYILFDKAMTPLCIYRGYVPKFPFDDHSFGDYIRLEVSHTGVIENWHCEMDFSDFEQHGQPISTEQYHRMLTYYLTPRASAANSAEDNAQVELAARIMLAAHKGQTDKAGKAYILHPMRIAVKCEYPEAMIVALLHDVLEDTTATPDFLRQQGFSDEIVEAVLSVTRRPEERYDDFIIRCSLNPIGRYVKILDLEDNLNVMRLSEVTPSTASRLNKYLKSLRFLKSLE